MKQAAAFPPNFIHSLDAAHMMYTAIACKKEGLTFAAVHDSYWTHATDIDCMSEKIRSCFVAMHKEDIMGNLKEEFEIRNYGHKYPATIRLDAAEKARVKDQLSAVGSVSARKSLFTVWVDLKFPSLPEVGKFDIGQIRDSKYFFH